MKKAKLELEIIDLTENGEGIAKFNNKIVFVYGAVAGDRVLAEVVLEKKKYIKARIIKLLRRSPDRIEVPCPYAYRCGGCSIMQLSYEKQLRYKEKFVKDALERIGKQKDYDFYPIIGMTFPYYYRNKAIYPFALVKNKVELGLYQRGTHRLVPVDTCMIQHEENRLIMSVIKNWANRYKIPVYQEQEKQGILRYLMIRSNTHNQHMVGLVVTDQYLKHKQELVKELKQLPIEIKSLTLILNKKAGNAVLGDKFIPVFGKAELLDTIDDIDYKLSLSSFFQVNHTQTARLYLIAEKLCGLTGQEIVWDIYSGVGSISLRLAKNAKWVFGNEIVPQAIENARENAELNGIRNVSFITGAAEEIVPTWHQKYPAPDVVVLDPPRKGADKKVLAAIISLAPQRIVYVSCKASTLARDVKILSENGYKLIEATPVDMFPHSGHVETVALLSKQDID